MSKKDVGNLFEIAQSLAYRVILYVYRSNGCNGNAYYSVNISLCMCQ